MISLQGPGRLGLHCINLQRKALKMSRFIPLSVPNFEGNEKKYVDDAIEQGWVSTGGAYITALEKKLAEFLETENVAACQSGTSALHLSLVEAGVKPGDTVIVPPLTFIAAVNPVKYQFATPVFIDCDDSFCMDPAKLRSFCEEECTWDGEILRHKGSHVKALVVVHVFGNMADMESIMDIAENITSRSSRMPLRRWVPNILRADSAASMPVPSEISVPTASTATRSSRRAAVEQ